jgi:hypothetical protein
MGEWVNGRRDGAAMNAMTLQHVGLTQILIGAVVVAAAIGRQFLKQRMSALTLFGPPAVCLVLGIQSLAQQPPEAPSALAILVAGGLVAAALGVMRGASMRIWTGPDGAVYRQGGWLTLGLWAVSFAVRLALGRLIATPLGGPAVSSAEIFLTIGLTFGAQALTLWQRAARPAGRRAATGAA